MVKGLEFTDKKKRKKKVNSKHANLLLETKPKVIPNDLQTEEKTDASTKQSKISNSRVS